MLVIDAAAVRTLYPMTEAIADMRTAFTLYSSGRVRQPQRCMTPGAAEGEVLATMPAYVPSTADGTGNGEAGAYGGGFGVKIIAVQPGNPARGLDPHPGAVLLLDPVTCVPLALLDATSITEIRTAAASAVATDLLARKDAEVLAVLGTGAQAREHIRAISRVRPLREIRVWGRTPVRARTLADECASLLPTSSDRTTALWVTRAAEAVAGADVICTVTAAVEPVLDSAWVAPGTHINAVGAVFPGRRELTGDLVARSAVLTDSRESALTEAGDLLVPMREGRLTAGHIRGEIGEVLLGTCAGRTSDDEITVFESLGLAVQDVISAHSVHRRAVGEGTGIDITLSAPGGTAALRQGIQA
ncbi:ornithine cyclodeaminase family protein [Streptomyces sp. NPDC004232]|uniref:ornithine cyclodeaminase family protein n=1 Tax=unclassified Streptomyces TaxID=2593676 RepID=UPI001DACE168|nr:ornithine cyclodeaminase family protein [Streptomyces sp. tea 10]